MVYVLAALLLLLLWKSRRVQPKTEQQPQAEIDRWSIEPEDDDLMIAPPLYRHTTVKFEQIEPVDGADNTGIAVVVRSGRALEIVPRMRNGAADTPPHSSDKLMVCAPEGRNMSICFELEEGTGNDVRITVTLAEYLELYVAESLLSSDGTLDTVETTGTVEEPETRIPPESPTTEYAQLHVPERKE
jgi:hypothetical protein